jgi:hypothetical protein
MFMGIKGAVGLCVLASLVAAPLQADDEDRPQDEDQHQNDRPRASDRRRSRDVDEDKDDDRDKDNDRDKDKDKDSDRDKDNDRDDDGDSDTDDGPKTGRSKPAPKKDANKPGDSKKEPAKQGAVKPESVKPGKPGGCVDVTTEARFASVGFDHVVTLKSGCKKTMKCTVKTNVRPEPVAVELASGDEESVVTWRGSPSRVYTAEVDCK